MKYSEEVLKKLKITGDHFNEIALGDKSLAVKAKAANISLRAYDAILKSEAGIEKVVDFIPYFMESITEMILRTELYRQYCTACIERDISAVNRNDFYEKVRLLGDFEDKRKNDGRYIIPEKQLINLQS